ncbi:hypothetical protein V6N13_050556 [Hibiscus sabdariffa]
MGVTVSGATVQAWGLFFREGCLEDALGLEQGCLVVEFLSFRVSPLGSQAPLKLASVRRARPSKAIWCLVFAVNDGALGAVTKHPILDPISIQLFE